MRIASGLLLLLLLTATLTAQTVDLSGLGTGTKSLAGQWKFHPGDDPRWADPNFDDSRWQSVTVPLSLNHFVTCLCARFEPSGRVIFANAGHLAPYWNGQELALSNGLPLGFGPATAYDEPPQFLSPSDTLTFLTDGVIEARDEERNLYGFDRLQQALTERLSADALARRAQKFGQDDDITFISICRQPVEAKPVSYQQVAPVAL